MVVDGRFNCCTVMVARIGVKAKLASLRQTSESEVNWDLTFQTVAAILLPRHPLAKRGVRII